ncbi:hypothetical protein ABW02_23105 [Niallia circulans]|uniref:Type II restriction enzyme n=1 Tax=Niallia circulans TaxID=1397 RepID=A0A0J1I6M4_NIACI|nr:MULTISPECIES: hypothetical protein [Niallia]EOR22135.1 hypothetical protein A499_19583 [Niallia nealsonii AAU1]SLL37517.1 Uncharacterised protein [Mycobacteroides abscessus subsp. abscessus]HEO8422563.1 hypothetical protein [Yersinia enterocolitica]KLV21567.1 hypothetical protein ABW02_23105 [Niallia circulans]MCB5237278.1 hypothetical protein [Niallia circulans]
MTFTLLKAIDEYKNDPESVYQTWFINNNDRLKAFRTIKNAIKVVIKEIENNTFPCDFKGSSLEVAISAIAEQKQIFEGAAHAFYWKPKLRIPDIYENEDNKKAFGQFLKETLLYNQEKQLIYNIMKLQEKNIKGLGPAVGNILYFLHPTIFPPFNTSIVKGFNMIFKQKIKLGSWEDYLTMREIMMEYNNNHNLVLSKDLGALAGLLYEIGSGRQVIQENHTLLLQDIDKVNKKLKKRHEEIQKELAEENEHTEMQYYLAKIGTTLGYNVWIAKNDHKREWKGYKLGNFSIPHLNLETISSAVSETISFIDVLWLNGENKVIGAFEVEKSTSIYSGILRLQDLSMSFNNDKSRFYLIAPNKRKKEIKAQLLRPSFQHDSMCKISYILFSDLREDCEAMCKFGVNISVLDKISN